jgi:hypothetical protein
VECQRCGCTSPRVKMENGLCASGVQCTKRLRARVGVRVVLQGSPLPTHEPERTEQLRIAREVRATYYRLGLCVDCGIVGHSPGRPRCEACHAQRA